MLGYIVEKKEKRGDWTPVNGFPVNDTKFSVMNLREGQIVEFRVKAVNDGGEGKPSKPTAPHEVRDAVCKWKISNHILIHSMPSK